MAEITDVLNIKTVPAGQKYLQVKYFNEAMHIIDLAIANGGGSLPVGNEGMLVTYDGDDIPIAVTFASIDVKEFAVPSGFDANNQTITSVYEPTDPTDAANKAYVDAMAYLLAAMGVTPGTILVVGAGGGVSGLAPGTNGDVLTLVAGVPAWVTP